MFKKVAVSPTTLPRLPQAGLKEAYPDISVSGLPWEKVKAKYKVIEFLDPSGIAFHAKDAAGESFAVKQGPIEKNECRLMTEVYLKIGLAPRTKECGIDYIIMELIEGEPLDDWVKKVSSPQILLASLRTLLDMIVEFDSLGIVHGDLHGHNIIVTKKGWRIIDYDKSYRGAQSEEESFCYAALDIIAQLKKVAPEVEEIEFDCTFDGLKEYVENLESVLVPTMAESTADLLRKLFT